MRETVILCPLEHEARVLRARLPGRRIEVSGPGRAVGRKLGALAASRPGLVVLAGLCGGLVESGAVPRITRVISARGQTWRVPVLLPDELPSGASSHSASVNARRLHDGAADRDGVTLIGVDEIVRSARAKRALGERFGADLCDMESHHFAFSCVEAGVRWAVVRGVSDGPNDELPDRIERLVDAQGNARLGAAIRMCAVRPWEIGGLLRLRKRSEEALERVALAVGRLIQREESDAPRAKG